MYNVCAEEEEEDGEGGAATRQSLENSITMNKMRQLKAKMEDMNLNKKVGIRWNERTKRVYSILQPKRVPMWSHIFLFFHYLNHALLFAMLFFGARRHLFVFFNSCSYSPTEKNKHFSAHIALICMCLYGNGAFRLIRSSELHVAMLMINSYLHFIGIVHPEMKMYPFTTCLWRRVLIRITALEFHGGKEFHTLKAQWESGRMRDVSDAALP